MSYHNHSRGMRGIRGLRGMGDAITSPSQVDPSLPLPFDTTQGTVVATVTPGSFAPAQASDWWGDLVGKFTGAMDVKSAKPATSVLDPLVVAGAIGVGVYLLTKGK